MRWNIYHEKNLTIPFQGCNQIAFIIPSGCGIPDRMDSEIKELDRLKLSITDGIIICIIVLFSVYWFISTDPLENQKAKVAIFHDNIRIYEIPVFKNQIIPLDHHGVHMSIEIQDSKVRVKFSDCPHQICVRKGWTGLVQDPIICMPNKVTVFIEGKDPDYDAITK